MSNKIIHFFNTIKNSIYLYVILFIFSIVYYFGYAFFGLDFTDTFFHLNNANLPNSEINFLTVLSSLIIKFLLNFVTENLLFLRFINGIIKVLPLFIYLYYFKIPLRSFLVWTFIILLILTPNNTFVLGYDSLSIFTFTLVLLILIKNLPNFSYLIILLLSLLSSCSILIRLPNILLVGILFLWILFSDGNKNLFSVKKIQKAFLYLIGTVFFSLLFYYCFYGNVATLLNSNNLGVKNSGHHGVLNLLYYYIRDFRKIFFFSVEISFLLWIYSKITINRSNKIWYLWIPIILFHFIFLFKYVFNTPYSFSFSLYVTAVMIVFVVHNLFFNNIQQLKTKVIIITFFLFLFLEPFGSNTGLLKAAPLLIIFPFIYQLSQLATKYIYILLFITILPLAILEKSNSIYEDSDLIKLRYTTKVKYIKGINTTLTRARFVNSIDTEYQKLIDDNYAVFFYGNTSQIFKYNYPRFDLHIKDFYQPIDLSYWNQISKEIKKYNKSAIFIVNDYPSVNINYHESLLAKELIENNFKPFVINNIVYYKN